MPSIETLHGTLEYTLVRKKVRNINLRVRPSGEVYISAPKIVSQYAIEKFILEKSAWISKARQKKSTPVNEGICPYTNEESFQIFSRVSAQVFPIFSDFLDRKPPELAVKSMKSRWGVCYPQKRKIVLNTFLATKPKEAIEYVILHEYVHFIHPNHQEGFHSEMTRLMPDYKERRKLLR